MCTLDGLTLIAVAGSSGSGKTELTKIGKEEYGFVVVKFADPLKEMLVALGLSDYDVNGPNHHRNTPHPLLVGKSPRHAMQTLGSEWRDLIDKTLWSNIAFHRIIDMYQAGHRRIMIDDLRFLHEQDAIRKLHGFIWKVRRPSVEPTPAQLRMYRFPGLLRFMFRWFGVRDVHVSEREWFGLKEDRNIYNEGTLSEYQNMCRYSIEAALDQRGGTDAND